MNMTDRLITAIRAVEVAERDIRVIRSELIAVSVEALSMDAVWNEEGDMGRRRLAKRLQFQRWRLAELYQPIDRLGNRVERRP